MSEKNVLDLASEAVRMAKAAGADEAEAFVARSRSVSVELQKNDIHCAAVNEETGIGIRVLRRGSIGFVNVNSADALRQACEEALAIAATAPPDPLNGLRDPEPWQALETSPDPLLSDLGIDGVLALANSVLSRIASRDVRVMVDSGEIGTRYVQRAVVNSLGVAASDERSVGSGSLFGMAVDGEEVGSFDYDGQEVTLHSEFEPELEAAADRFMIKTLGALGARKGETFRGPVILTPETVYEFVVGNLFAVLSGKAVRLGKSPFQGRLGQEAMSPMLSLFDRPRQPHATGSEAFDREGTPTRDRTIVHEGVLRSFLYDVYEARAAQQEPGGHARGGASGVPAIGPSNIVLEAGDQSFSRLCTDPVRAVVVSRFSGSCNPVTGEFSGVVKGGFLMHRGERTPVKEVLIAGNLYEALRKVSGVSEEIRNLGGRVFLPALRIEDISVTAG